MGTKPELMSYLMTQQGTSPKTTMKQADQCLTTPDAASLLRNGTLVIDHVFKPWKLPNTPPKTRAEVLMIHKPGATFCNSRGTGVVPADPSGPGPGVNGRSASNPSSSATVDAKPASHPNFLS